MLDRNNILVFDFETTGLSALNDEILEVGAIKLEKVDGNFIVTDELSLILNTTNPISAKITEITGITNELQSLEGVSQEEGFMRLSSLIDEDTLLVAYNIQFDLGFLKQFYVKNFNPSYKITNDVLDCMAVYKDRNKFPHRLESAISTYGIEFPNTHRALDDAKATYEVLRVMNEEQANINKYINVIGYNAKYGVSGERLPHVRYVTQSFNGLREIEKL